jgi:hypothetical protein
MKPYVDPELEPGWRTGPTPADRAANTGLKAAIVAFLGLGLGSWAGLVNGLFFLVGLAIWLVAMSISIGFATAALRNWFSSVDSRALRRKAWLALGIDGAAFLVFCAYINTVIRPS